MNVVALHGFTGSAKDFEPLAERLSVPVHALDLLGHGEAAAPDRCEDYRMVAQVRRLVDKIPDGPLVLLGYSIGGRVALRLWPLLGARLKGVVLVATTPGLEDPVERTERIAQDLALAARIEARGVPWFTEYWSERPIIRSQKQIEPAILEGMRKRRLQNRPVGLANTLRALGQGAVEPVWSTLPDFPVPTLLLTGANDRKYTDIATEMSRRIPNATHQIVGDAGHCVHLEAVNAAAAAIQGFLGSLSE